MVVTIRTGRKAGEDATNANGTDEGAAPPPPSKREIEAQRLFALATEHHRQGRLDEAIAGYTRVLAYQPAHPDAYNNLGVALRVRGKFAAAVACYRRALGIRPDNSGTWSNLGNVLRDLGRLEEAVAAHQRAVSLAPRSAEAVYNLGLVLKDMGQTDTAIACFVRTLEINPEHVDCHWDRALTHLMRGDLERGFAEYEWRWRRPDSPPRGFPQPLWDGSDLEGRTLLLHQEQGLGDTIQFVRYAPMIKERGATVIVECQPELARLFSGAPGVDMVAIRGGPLPAFDTFAPMMSLGRIFGTTLETIPAPIPYLFAPDLHSAHLAVAPGTRLNVGIAWAGKPTHRNDRNRSCPFFHFIELMDTPGVAFYSLQKGERAADLRDAACEALVADAGAVLHDLLDTAAVVEQLDLVITVDTALAHLAGAMGRAVWVLLPYVPDWRWLMGRDDSPWYPTLRLFRQERPGDWAGVFLRVREALEATTTGP